MKPVAQIMLTVFSLSLLMALWVESVGIALVSFGIGFAWFVVLAISEEEEREFIKKSKEEV